MVELAGAQNSEQVGAVNFAAAVRVTRGDDAEHHVVDAENVAGRLTGVLPIE